MGFEGIEQYLIECERQALNNIDQEVPDSFETMQTDFEPSVTNFYPDDGKSPLTQVPIAQEQGSPYQPDETSDYCDLDERRDFFIYDMDQASGSPEQNTCDSSVQSPVIQQSSESFMYYINIKNRALNEYRKDVEHTCRCLGIALDPLSWTHDHVQQWVVWQCGQFKVPAPNMEYFFISGLELCSMNEADFQSFAPGSGSTLYAQLVCWRSVVEQTMNQTYTDVLPTISTVPVPASPCRTSSSGSASPTPSSCSEYESQPETPPTHSPTCEDDDRLPEEPVHHHRQTIQLWQFLKLLLLDGHYTDCIRWLDRSRGIFKIENSSKVARLWGKRKNRPAMNYDKLSRSIRQYYKKNIIKKTEQSKRLVYQFCQNVL